MDFRTGPVVHKELPTLANLEVEIRLLRRVAQIATADEQAVGLAEIAVADVLDPLPEGRRHREVVFLFLLRLPVDRGAARGDVEAGAHRHETRGLRHVLVVETHRPAVGKWRGGYGGRRILL